MDMTARHEETRTDLVLWTLMTMARIYEQGGIVIAEHIEPGLRGAAEAILGELAASFHHLPVHQRPVQNDSTIQ
jgi:hypothetical protein